MSRFSRYSSPCGTGRGKEPRHHLAGQPVGRIETGRGAESGEPVGTADPFGCREAAAEPVADDRPHLFRPRGGVAPLLAALPDPAVVDGDRPVIEQVASDRDLVAAVVVLLSIVGFKGDGEQILY